jgi:hypothetical protein
MAALHRVIRRTVAGAELRPEARPAGASVHSPYAGRPAETGSLIAADEEAVTAKRNGLVIAPMIETNQSRENLDAIASVPGVFKFFTMPWGPGRRPGFRTAWPGSSANDGRRGRSGERPDHPACAADQSFRHADAEAYGRDQPPVTQTGKPDIQLVDRRRNGGFIDFASMKSVLY